MKTKITYPERARKAKAILIAVLFSVQASIIASDSSKVDQKFSYANDAYVAGTEFSNSFVTGNAYDYLYEEAYEAEMEIEEWMYNIQTDYINYNSDDNEMEIEEWMCNIHHSFWLDLSDAEDSEPAIESWMYNTQHSFWFDLDDAEESELAIESWMTNPSDWINTSDELMLTSL